MQSILIYYNIRGKAQVVRNLLCYLEIDFVDLHLDLIQIGVECPTEQILNRLKNNPIDKQRLPLLIAGENYIYGTHTISLYICKKYAREDLFGKSQYQTVANGDSSSEVKKILQNIIENQIKCKSLLLHLAQQCFQKSEKEIRQLINLTYENVMENSCYIRQICQILQNNQSEHFIFGGLTIIDFYFLETCFYILGFFGKIVKSSNECYGQFYNSISTNHSKNKSNKCHLLQMKRFVDKMKALPFYQKNLKYLESYSLIYSKMNEEKINGIKKIWGGESKYIH